MVFSDVVSGATVVLSGGELSHADCCVFSRLLGDQSYTSDFLKLTCHLSTWLSMYAAGRYLKSDLG